MNKKKKWYEKKRFFFLLLIILMIVIKLSLDLEKEDKQEAIVDDIEDATVLLS